MKKILATLVLSITLSLSAAETISGKVAKLVDGDTMHLDTGKAIVKIRMISIDTPETHFNGKSQEPWGTAAAEFLAKRIPLGTEVKVESFGEDKYHRVLGKVTEKGTDINLEMVKSGWAIPYIICDGPKCNKDFIQQTKAKDYVAACNAAQKNHEGIFNKEKPLTEMPFEFRMRIDKRKPEKWVGNIQNRRYQAPDQYKKIAVCDRIFFMSEADAKKAGFTQ